MDALNLVFNPLEFLFMRSRLELSPSQRLLWTVVAVALLLWGASGGYGLFFAALAGSFIIGYAAGGGRIPWKITWRDYFLYVAISVALVVTVILYVWVSR